MRSFAFVLGAFALALLTLGLAVRRPGAVGSGLTVLGAEYGVLFGAEGANLDRYTPIYAVGFLLVAELAFWSIERRIPAWSEAQLVERRLARLVAACTGAAALAALVIVAAAAATGGGGLVLETAGVLATVGSVALLALLVRRFFAEGDSRA